MANQEHLRILEQGGVAWNQWRDQHRDIRPDLSNACLSGTNLDYANLTRTDLRGAKLHEAQLAMTNLTRADLTGADLSRAFLFETIFGDTNLTDVHGVETCFYAAPSSLDHRTLAKSGPLPLVFLRGCGLNDWEIEAIKLHQPGLTPPPDKRHHLSHLWPTCGSLNPVLLLLHQLCE